MQPIILQKTFKQKTVVEQVMEEMKSLIASGQFKVNDQIPPEMELAERFGVSRPTIREAIKVFNYLGVLNSKTGKGTYVSDRAHISTEALTWALLLGTNEMRDLIELREVIETRGLMKLVELYTEGDTEAIEKVKHLKEHIEHMQMAVEKNSKEELNQADFNFHLTIIGAGHNEVFTAIYDTLQSFMLEEMHKTHEAAEDAYQIVAEHKQILSGILSQESEKALDAFNAHMSSKCFDKIREIL